MIDHGWVIIITVFFVDKFSSIGDFPRREITVNHNWESTVIQLLTSAANFSLEQIVASLM